MKPLAILALFFALAACGTVREIAGTSPTLAPDQIVWIERTLESDFSSIAAAAGRRVVEGKVIARADGEVISCRPMIQAAKRGLLHAGGTEVEGGEADLIIVGELNVNAAQEGRRSERRYVLEMKVVEVATRAVLYVQQYTVINRHEQKQWR